MTKVFRFGPFKFDPATGILVKDGNPFLLGGRAAALLSLLLEDAGRPVMKDALIERAWGRLVVEDSNLTVQIAAIRGVFRETAGAEWIETLPRRGYRYAGPEVAIVGEEALASAPMLAPEGRPSIAVLAFENHSPEDTPVHFIDGMVDEIVTGLARIKWLFVIDRKSSFRFREQPADVRVAARELGVRYVLTGSLRRLGNRVRLGAHLLEGETCTQVWARRFERTAEDVFALQDEVALAVLAALEPGMREAEFSRVARQRPGSLNAYDLVLRSQADVFSGMPGRSTRALPLIDEALRLEPEYALAHGYAAMAYHNCFLRGGVLEQDRLRAVAHARAAIQHGQDDSMALALGAFSLAMDDHDLASASPAFEAAVDVSPSTALTYILGSAVHGWAGNAGAARAYGEKGLRLSPFDPWRFAAWHGLMLDSFRGGRLEEALDAAYRSVATNLGHSISYALLAAALVRCGRDREGSAAAARVLALQPAFSSRAHLSAVNCEPTLGADLLTAFAAAGLPP